MAGEPTQRIPVTGMAKIRRASRLRRAAVWAGLAAAVAGAGLGVLVVCWGADSLLTRGEVARGVRVGDRGVAGLGEEHLRTAVRGMARAFAEQSVRIDTPSGELETTAGELGLSIDVEETARSALAMGRTEPLLRRPWDWVAGVVGDRQSPITYRINRTLVAHVTGELLSSNRVEVAEPTIEPTDDGWEVVDGSPGEAIELEDLLEELASALETEGAPVELAMEPVEVQPRFSAEDAERLAAEADRLTSDPLEVSAGGLTRTADPALLRSFVEPVAGAERLELAVDADAVREWLEASFAELTVAPRDARFEIGFGVVLHPSKNGQRCCAEGSETALFEALGASAGARSVTLELEVLKPELPTSEAESLGIVEPVASFTTNYACCQGRVTNIHRIADLMRGAVMMPGESFSINGYVGERTREKGFVEAGAIFNGEFTEDVGGGVSQFATTIFNAGFFAGLEFDEYQMHTIYISRYPYGREATISYPAPDLRIRNVSPYGVLIWPTYTETSITVTLWSTRWVEADQTGQETRRDSRGCTHVTTERTRRFLSEEEATRIRGGPPTGGEDPLEVRDEFFGVYQPAEGVVC